VVDKLIETRRYRRLRLEDVKRFTRSLAKLKPFIVAADWTPGGLTDRADLRAGVAPEPEQLRLF
jgi:predicted DNA-binding helix-hairpin-helix protein